MCSEDDDWLVSPPMRDTKIAAALADALRAAELGTPGATELVDIAWLRLLRRSEPGPGGTALHEAADLAGEARGDDRRRSPGIHVARFNHAVARLATGRTPNPGTGRRSGASTRRRRARAGGSGPTSWSPSTG